MAEESAVNYWEVCPIAVNRQAEHLSLVLTKCTEVRGCRVQCEPKGGPHHLCTKNQTKDHVEWQFR